MAIVNGVAVKRCAVLHTVLFILGLLVAACTSVQYQADRLHLEVGKASQEDVANVFGPPAQVKTLPDGETEWRYRYLRTASGGAALVGKRTCWEHILRFDQDTVLREHRRVSC